MVAVKFRMNRSILIVASAIAFLSTSPTISTASNIFPPIPEGNVNCDSHIGLSDAVAALKILSGMPADLMICQKIEAADLIYILQVAAGLRFPGQILTKIVVAPASPSILTGKFQQFRAAGTFADGETRDITSEVTWRSSDVTVATVDSDSGFAAGLAEGTSTISALSDNLSASMALTVLAGHPGLWVAIPSGAPVSTDHTAVWTGAEMIVWGDDRLNSGGTYDPGTNSWNSLSTADAPQERHGHTAIWSGTEMMVWGGIHANILLNSGGRYNPAADAWRSVSTADAPSARRNHTAIWTGAEMIVWGGVDANAPDVSMTNTGGRYNPLTDTWLATSTLDAPPPSYTHRAVWTGSEMIVWDGSAGGRYNPGTNTWKSLSPFNAPLSASDFTAVWSGTEMIVWGGWTGLTDLVTNTGKRYNPVTDMWNNLSPLDAPSARYRHTAVWTGREMIVWGGSNGQSLNSVYDGGRYNPETDTWTAISSTGIAAPRWAHTAVWTDTEMIVWGGWNSDSGFSWNNGCKYLP